MSGPSLRTRAITGFAVTVGAARLGHHDADRAPVPELDEDGLARRDVSDVAAQRVREEASAGHPRGVDGHLDEAGPGHGA